MELGHLVFLSQELLAVGFGISITLFNFLFPTTMDTRRDFKLHLELYLQELLQVFHATNQQEK